MTISSTASRPAVVRTASGSAVTLLTALLGFFLVTLDAVIVNVALPDIRADLGGGIRGFSGWSTATR